MLATEKETETKTCCSPTAGRSRCFGPNCMGWRWFDRISSDGKTCISPNDGRVSIPYDRRGYCGIAGAANQ